MKPTIRVRNDAIYSRWAHWESNLDYGFVHATLSHPKRHVVVYSQRGKQQCTSASVIVNGRNFSAIVDRGSVDRSGLSRIVRRYLLPALERAIAEHLKATA